MCKIAEKSTHPEPMLSSQTVNTGEASSPPCTWLVMTFIRTATLQVSSSVYRTFITYGVSIGTSALQIHVNHLALESLPGGGWMNESTYPIAPTATVAVRPK